MTKVKHIAAIEVLRAISTGMTRQELMNKFGLSASGMVKLLDRLSSERHRRAARIAADFKAGMSPEEIAEKNGFTIENFEKIMTKLKGLGILSDLSPAAGATKLVPERAAQDRRRAPRVHSPVLVTRVYEEAAPDRSGLILDMSETGLGILGIHGRPNEKKTFAMNVSDFTEADGLKFDCLCKWVSAQNDSSVSCKAGFEITSISENSLALLKTIVATEFSIAAIA